MSKSSNLSTEDWVSIGVRIKTRRQELRIKQTELAESIEVSTNHMSAIERGVQHPSVNTLKRIAEELGVSMDYFMLGNMHSHNILLNIIDRLMICKEKTSAIILKLIPILDEELPDSKK